MLVLCFEPCSLLLFEFMEIQRIPFLELIFRTTNYDSFLKNNYNYITSQKSNEKLGLQIKRSEKVAVQS